MPAGTGDPDARQDAKGKAIKKILRKDANDELEPITKPWKIRVARRHRSPAPPAPPAPDASRPVSDRKNNPLDKVLLSLILCNCQIYILSKVSNVQAF